VIPTIYLFYVYDSNNDDDDTSPMTSNLGG